MSIESISQEIDLNNEEIEKTKLELSKQRSNIVEFAKLFIKEAQLQLIEEIIKMNPEKTLALGTEKLGELKACLRQIDEQTYANVDVLLSKPIFWSDISIDSLLSPNGDIGGQIYNINRNVRPSILLGIRTLFGAVGGLLSDFGFVSPLHVTKYTSGYGQEWLKTQDLGIIYDAPLKLPKDLDNAIQLYCSDIKKALELFQKRYSLSKHLLQQQASDLWASS